MLSLMREEDYEIRPTCVSQLHKQRQNPALPILKSAGMPLTEPKSEPFRLTRRGRRSTIAQWNQVQSSAAERSLPA